MPYVNDRRVISHAHADQAKALYLDGAPMREIVHLFGVKSTTGARAWLKQLGISTPEASDIRRKRVLDRAKKERGPARRDRKPDGIKVFLRSIPQGAFGAYEGVPRR